MGVPCRVSTLDQSRDKGKALSRANAHVHLDAATVIEIEQNSVMIRMRNVRPTPKMYGRACPTGAPSMSSNGGIVAQMGMIKKRPAIPPTGTHSDMAFGSFVVGSPHSSAMDVIIPIAENLHLYKYSSQIDSNSRETTYVYAAGSMPMKNENPPQPERDVS